MNVVFRRSTSGPIAARGSVLVTSSPQYRSRVTPLPVAWPASCETRSTPSLPSMSVSTSARARSGSATGMPCTSATDWAKSVVASRNADGLDAAERERDAGADARERPRSRRRRHRRSSRRRGSGARGCGRSRRSSHSGCRRRMLRRCATTTGRWMASTRSSVRIDQRMLVRAGRRKTSRPRRVVGEGVDAVHLVGHNGPILCVRAEQTLGLTEGLGQISELRRVDQTNRFARSRSSAKSTSTA